MHKQNKTVLKIQIFFVDFVRILIDWLTTEYESIVECISNVLRQTVLRTKIEEVFPFVGHKLGLEEGAVVERLL